MWMPWTCARRVSVCVLNANSDPASEAGGQLPVQRSTSSARRERGQREAERSGRGCRRAPATRPPTRAARPCSAGHDQRLGEGQRVVRRIEDVGLEQVQRIARQLVRDPRQDPLVQLGVGVVVARITARDAARAARCAASPAADRPRRPRRGASGTSSAPIMPQPRVARREPLATWPGADESGGCSHAGSRALGGSHACNFAAARRPSPPWPPVGAVEHGAPGEIHRVRGRHQQHGADARGPRPVDVTINRWSTDADRDRLLAVFRDKGQDALLAGAAEAAGRRLHQHAGLAALRPALRAAASRGRRRPHDLPDDRSLHRLRGRRRTVRARSTIRSR